MKVAWYVGMDVHLKTTTICILDADGKPVKNFTVKGTWGAVREALLREVSGPFAVCYEASCSYGYLYDDLVRYAARVEVAHPGALRLIFASKRKNDRLDAGRLAKLLFLGEVPRVHVPALEVRAWRGMIEHRRGLVDARTQAKNRLRGLLRTYGVTAPRGLWTKKGTAWLAQVELPTALDRVRRDQWLAEVRSLDALIDTATQALDEIAQQHPGVRRLQTIPGVGPRTAEAVVAYLDDPHRFSRSKQVGSYLGLVPCQDASAGVNRLGHITKQGPGTVRKLLTEAVWRALRLSPTIKAYFQRVRRDDRKRTKIAIVATAHYLARAMHAMLLRGQDWRESVEPEPSGTPAAGPAAA